MASFIYNGRSKAALTMTANLIADLKDIVSASRSRTVSLRAIAGAIRRSGSYRWVGLYDGDHGESLVCNVVFSGTDAPAHLTFPIRKGLTGVFIAFFAIRWLRSLPRQALVILALQAAAALTAAAPVYFLNL